MLNSLDSARVYSKIKCSNTLTKIASDASDYTDSIVSRVRLNNDIFNDLVKIGSMSKEAQEEYKDEEKMGMLLSIGASKVAEDITVLKEHKPVAAEKKAQILNEVMKIGCIDSAIKKMASNKEKEKIAQELMVLNRDYLVKVLGEII